MPTNSRPPIWAKWPVLWRVSRQVVLALGMIAGLAILLLVLAGVFKRKVQDEPVRFQEPRLPTGTKLAPVRQIRRPRFESAVGTVRASHEAAVASKILARVLEVNVKAGQAVARDEVLVRLDDADLQARVKQAEAAAAAAGAVLTRAEADHARAVELRKEKLISQEEFDHVEAALRTAQAERERTLQAAREARILLDFATIRSPLTGVVIDKRVEPGDTASPGQVLLTLYNPQTMQMVVTVRESLALQLKVGQKVPGRLESLNLDCEATISEIVPEAQTASRSFTVKVTGPCPPGAYSGMFGRIFIPQGEEDVVLIPDAAITRVGQLTMVDVATDGMVRRRSVQLGRRWEEGVEVLAGLSPGEQVVLRAGDTGAARP